MAEGRRARFERWVLRSCVLAWPVADREGRGREMVAISVRLVEDERGPGRAWALAGEAFGLVVAGLGRRRKGRGRGRGPTGRVTGGVGMAGTGDVRFALRSLWRAPGFTIVAVATLALGIGANMTIFSLVDAVLLRPPPYESPDELVLVWSRLPGSEERIPISGPDAAVVRASAERFSEAAFTIRGVDGFVETGPDGVAEHVTISAVTADFFDVLGVQPALGRIFDASDGPAGEGLEGPSASAIVLSHDAWRGRFGADPDLVGREIRLNGMPATVVGVMAPDFRLVLPPDVGVSTEVDVWVPLQVPLTAFHRDDQRLLDQDSDNTGALVARLAPGATLEQARAEMRIVAAGLREELPAYAASGVDLDVRPLLRDATAHARPLLMALLAGCALVLLVATLNISTLVLARSLDRSREFAVRASLGAGRVRLLRQLLVEGVVMVALGFGASLLLALVALPIVSASVPGALAPDGPIRLETRTIVFAAALSGIAAVVFGFLPARVARRSPNRTLSGGRGSSGRRGRSRDVLVALQVALSVVLLSGAGLLARTVVALDDVRPGFEPEAALSFQLSMRVPGKYRSPAYRAELMSEISSRIATLPGVRAVGLVGVLPLGGDRWTQPYGLPGQPESRWTENRADFRVVTSGAFEALGATILEGRTFSADEDLIEAERVVVVDEKLASRLAPGGSAIDMVLGVPVDGAAVRARVVGVVEHIRHERLDADGREAVYVPYRQEASRDVGFVVRTESEPGALADPIRRAIQEIDPQIPVYDLTTLNAYVARAVAPRRFALGLLLGFAALALLCSAIGLYGVIAFDVRRGTRDIGLRLAVGATGQEVVRGVIGSGLRLVAFGLGLGIALAALVSRSMGALTYGVGAADPWVWSWAVVTVLVVALCATWLPAWRASRLSPTVALRSD